MFKYMGFMVLFLFFYRGIELGIENHGISLELVDTTFLVS